MSSAETFRRLRELFDRLAESPEPERTQELARLATSEPGLARELLEMLRVSDIGDSPLDRAVIRVADGEPFFPVVPGFRILRQLGVGGSATVYLAEQEKSDFQRLVALKVIDRVLGPESLRRVRDEQRILARLEHRGIARLYDAGVTSLGQPYLAMERVEGESILEHCRLRELAVGERLRIFLDVLEAVGYAHHEGVVHRDLKPANILITTNGEAKLLDFGIAKLIAGPQEEEETRTLRRALTPAYASPEQVRGDRVSPASDIYSLGVVLYELLAEVRPYRIDGVRFQTVEDAIRTQDPDPPSVAVTRPPAGDTATRPLRERFDVALRRRALRGDLDAVVLKALRKEPEARYASAAEFVGELRRVLDRQPVAARGANRRYRMGRFLRRHGKVLATAAVLIPLVVIVAAGAIPQWSTRQRQSLASKRPAAELAVYSKTRTGNPEGLRALRDGAEKLRGWDLIAARDSFTRASSLLEGAPTKALAFDGLARTETALGEIGRASAAALAAANQTAGLPPEEIERIAARGLAASGDWVHAVPALDRAFARRPDRIDLGIDLVSALLGSGQTEAANATLARLQQLPSQADPTTRDPRLELSESEIAYRLGEHQRSAAAATRARDWAASHGVTALRLRAERALAEATARLDLREQARVVFERVAAEATTAGLVREAVRARLGLGRILARTANNDEAESTLEQALTELRAAGDRAGEVDALIALAFQASKRGELSSALSLSSQAVAVAREIGDRWSEGEALVCHLAMLSWSADLKGIAETRDQALRALRESANRQSLLQTLNNLALDATERRELDRAEAYLDEAEALAQRVGGRFANAGLDRARGFLEESRGALDLARQSYEAALEKASKAELPTSVALYLSDLAWLEMAADRPEAAATRAAEAIAAYRAVGKLSDATEMEGVLAWVEACRGDGAAAHRRLDAMRTALSDGEGANLTLLTVAARVAESLRDWPEAITLRRQAMRLAEQGEADGVLIEQRYWLARDLNSSGQRDEFRKIAEPLLVEAERRGVRGIARDLRKLLDAGS